MERFEHLLCLYRDAQGRIREEAYPADEPRQGELTADLYAVSYGVVKGMFGPPRLRDLEVCIFNTRGYRPDPELEEEAKRRLVREIQAKEGAEIFQASGGEAAVQAMITVDTWFADKPRR